MTLNGVIALILLYFTEFDSFAGQYITVVEDKTILSAGYRILFYFWPKLIHSAERSLCDS